MTVFGASLGRTKSVSAVATSIAASQDSMNSSKRIIFQSEDSISFSERIIFQSEDCLNFSEQIIFQSDSEKTTVSF